MGNVLFSVHGYISEYEKSNIVIEVTNCVGHQYQYVRLSGEMFYIKVCTLTNSVN